MSLQALAQQASDIKEAYSAGTISADEFKELIESMDVMQSIEDQTAYLDENIMYREILVNIINIAKAVA
jgi:tape measure domain-containing protein|tara:strand:- start:1191 stop:1397 length:207 start_codon:yes stop_codon:yes gene_type:complete